MKMRIELEMNEDVYQLLKGRRVDVAGAVERAIAKQIAYRVRHGVRASFYEEEEEIGEMRNEK